MSLRTFRVCLLAVPVLLWIGVWLLDMQGKAIIAKWTPPAVSCH